MLKPQPQPLKKREKKTGGAGDDTYKAGAL
jgi:hypothetical protein